MKDRGLELEGVGFVPLLELLIKRLTRFEIVGPFVEKTRYE
jgi:hypothetical protein